MSILQNKYEIIDEKKGNQGYTLPAILKKDERELTFKKSVAISTALHPFTVALIVLIMSILTWAGIDLFRRPALPDKKDIEFVLVDKNTPEAPPRDPNTKNRADRNSRSGGHRDMTKPVVMPTGTETKPSKPSGASSDLQKMVQKQQQALKKQQSQKPKQTAPQKSLTKSSAAPNNSTRQVTKQSPKPPVARPTAAPSNRPVSAPKTVAPKQTTPFAVPVPSGAPRGNYLSTGPVGGTGAKSGNSRSGGTASGNGTGSRNYAPTPSLSTYSGNGKGKGTGTGTGSSRGTGSGKGTGGYAGNPGGGGGRPGIDAIKEPDFGPYMRDLQRRIKYNWHPPKGNESRKVVLLFKIAKNGQMLSCRVYKSSGLPSADQAALNAVKMTAPFRPLPAEYKGSNIDIQFTFDYNVFGASMSR